MDRKMGMERFAEVVLALLLVSQQHFFLSISAINFRSSISFGVDIDQRGRASESERKAFLWPLPAEWSKGGTTLRIDPHFELVVHGNGRESTLVPEAFERYKKFIFDHQELELQLMTNGRCRSSGTLQRLIVNIASRDEKLQHGINETYYLKVPAEGDASDAYLEAENVYGALRGLETFSQLCQFNFTSRSVEIAYAPWEIRDAPRFQYRGLLIDTGRHFLPVNVIKSVIDAMSYAKLNVLHWHIVDSQSFPLESTSFPHLWNGAYTKYERYTLDDARSIVEYARTRGVNVLPELDVPGHAASWGHGYPELWPSAYCAEPLDVSSNFTFEVIGSVLSELREIFPYEFIHLGGDEVNTGCWNNTPRIRQWLTDNNLSPHDAYAYFVLRAQEMALALGWDPINWQEPFDEFPDKLNPKTVVHEWWEPGVTAKAVAKGFRSIVSNQDVWYLDHLDAPWDRFYMNEPLDGITHEDQQRLVLGGEVCMWGETADPSDIQQTIWPRAAAAAERLWSPRESIDKGPLVALPRLEHFKCLLHRRGIAAAPVRNSYARMGPSRPGSCYAQ